MPKKTNIKPIPIQAAGGFRKLGGGGVVAATANGDVYSQQLHANSIGRNRFIPKGYPDKQISVTFATWSPSGRPASDKSPRLRRIDSLCRNECPAHRDQAGRHIVPQPN